VVAHSDRGLRYTSLRYGALRRGEDQTSAGSVGDSFDNATGETINGLDKTEMIKRQGPWKTVDDVEIATAEWGDWVQLRRLYEYCGDIPPAELGVAYYAQHQRHAVG
jgi:putative transposase